MCRAGCFGTSDLPRIASVSLPIYLPGRVHAHFQFAVDARGTGVDFEAPVNPSPSSLNPYLHVF